MNYDNFDTLHIAYKEDGDNSSLVVLRNKRAIKTFSGKTATKLWLLLTKKIGKTPGDLKK